MGAQGTGPGIPGDLVFDAGALIAYERGSVAMAVLVDEAIAEEVAVAIPAGALAQVWRGGPRSARLAWLLEGCDVDPLDENRAKEAGLRLGARGGADVIDAHVVCCAMERGAAVATSDPDDIAALADTGEPLTLIEV